MPPPAVSALFPRIALSPRRCIRSGNDKIVGLFGDVAVSGPPPVLNGTFNIEVDGGEGNGTFAPVFQSGQHPTAHDFQTVQSFADFAALLAAFPELALNF
jgi:hypothetical protein